MDICQNDLDIGTPFEDLYRRFSILGFKGIEAALCEGLGKVEEDYGLVFR